MPELSIIIPCRNRVDLLRACLQAIYRHVNQLSLQVIVVDDASPQANVCSLAFDYPNVQLIRLSKPSGFCTAINAGLRLAQAPIVQVLNDDTEVQQDWWKAPLQRFQECEQLGSVAPLVLNWKNPKIIDSAGDGYDPGGYAFSYGKGKRIASEWLVSREVFSAPGSAAFYRKGALIDVGGFPEEFTAYFDDIEVGFKLRKAGYTCWYEPQSKVLHHGSASHGKRPNRKLTEQLARNEERVFLRHHSAVHSWKCWSRHAAVLGAKAIRRLADGTLLPFCMGRARAWGEALWQPDAPASGNLR